MRPIWILRRYICTEYLRWFAFCLLGFVGLALVVDVVEKSATFIKKKAEIDEIARYVAYQLPEFTAWMIAPAALFAMLIALAGLMKRNEVTAMLAGGVGRRTIVAPMATLALVAAFAQFALSEYVVPETNAQKRYVLDTKIKKKSFARHRDRRNRWFYVDGGFLHIGVIDESRKLLSGVLYLKPGEKGSPPLRIEGSTAQWNEAASEWRLLDASVAEVDSAGMLSLRREPETALPVQLQPTDLADKVSKTEEWSAADLRKIIRDRSRLGQSVIKESVELYSRYSLPLAGFVMALLGAPFAFREHRRGGAATGFVIGVVIAFAYFVVMAMSRSVGIAGGLPPEIAAWLPNAVFGGTGLYLAVTLDQM